MTARAGFLRDLIALRTNWNAAVPSPGDLPEVWRQNAEMYAGCVAGAIQKDEYLGQIERQGFSNITIQKEKVITIPDDILNKLLSEEEIVSVKAKNTGIFSITVFAEKPGGSMSKEIKELSAAEEAPCCEPDAGCC